MREGEGNCLKYLKRRWNRKEGTGNKDFKKEGNLGQGVGALKRVGGGWNPLTHYESNFSSKIVGNINAEAEA